MTTTSATNNTITLAQASNKTTTTTQKSSGFSSEDFLKLLIDQMRNQDPSSSMSESDMANQMAQYQNILELEKMSKALTTMNTTNQKLSATTMIGKTISYTDSTSKETVYGKVDSVEFSDTDVLLNIGTKQIALADVIGVSDGSVSNGGSN
jgi:flagellar basal-body rod modification protein FlgD